MSLYRSEAMMYVRILMGDESAHNTMAAIGDFGSMHLVDLSTPDIATEAATYWKKRVQACDGWEKRLEAFADPAVLEEYGLKPPPPLDSAPVKDKSGDILLELQGYLEPSEVELAKNMQFRAMSSQALNELKERKVVFEISDQRQEGYNDHHDREGKGEGGSRYGGTDRRDTHGNVMTSPLIGREEKEGDPFLVGDRDSGNISNRIVGVIPTDRQAFFERMIFRMSRGNAITQFSPIDTKIMDPATGELMSKSFFSVVFVGAQLRARIFKTCATFNATRYTIPATPAEMRRALDALNVSIGESATVLNKTTAEISGLLSGILYDRHTGRSPLADWIYHVRRERAISDAMRKCDLSNPRATNIKAEGWIPVEEQERLREVITHSVRAGHRAALEVPPKREQPAAPPTYFRTNQVTETFQGIVDTYGVPRYQEVNPGMFTIVTFPFLFGVMYGDIGHGLILTMGALYILYREKYFLEELRTKRITDEIFKMVFSARYLIVMMGLFAVYCGTIYNDCMSIPIDAFGSQWTMNSDNSTYTWSGVPYPYGVDPSWYHTTNELAFMNSLKMKLAVTIGVIHMTFGVFLSLSNHLYWHDNVGVFCEFLPRVLFLTCTFGYMIFIIIFKMCCDWHVHNPPNLVVTMIDMFLSPGTVDESKQLYEGQATVQAVLLLIAFVSVPWMLFGPPCVIKSRVMALRKKRAHLRPHDNLAHDGGTIGGHLGEGKEEKQPVLHASSSYEDAHDASEHAHGMPADIWNYNFGDSMITAGIHTIEYVLGAVSNTASYLRLWALSLAHSELAQVFWSKMMMENGVESSVPGMGVIGFAVWLGATAGVLLAMDVLECFLHALRLHWVEFQNKFFYADGYLYVPFKFTLEPAEKK